jgi:hypothetical protein
VKQKHLEWFNTGARTLRAVANERELGNVFPTGEDWYLCPLCLGGLTVEEFGTGELTVEHVPPESLGGGELVLTCKTCNNRAGTSFDSHAHRQERLRHFLSGHSGKPEKASVTIGDLTTNVDMHVAGQSGLLFIEIPKINNPASTELMEQRMRELGKTPGAEYTITAVPRLRYHPDQARVSWIRTGYLAAFALLGWNYILWPGLRPIRDQLMNPGEITAPPLSMYIPEGDADRREIWIVKRPAEYQSVLVVWGRHGIFLPLPNDPRDLESFARELGAPAGQPVTFSFTGDSFAWPSGPEHLLDPH